MKGITENAVQCISIKLYLFCFFIYLNCELKRDLFTVANLCKDLF